MSSFDFYRTIDHEMSAKKFINKPDDVVSEMLEVSATQLYLRYLPKSASADEKPCGRQGMGAPRSHPRQPEEG